MSAREPVRRVAIVGTGTIGAGWATHHLARGFDVVATDPVPGAETQIRNYVHEACDGAATLGLADGASSNVAVRLGALVAACGGGGSSTTAASKPAGPAGSAATFGVASNSGLGKILVSSKGLTLYLFKKDTGTQSTCTGPCATNWPPLRASGKPLAGSGLSTSKVATTTRSDGKAQVTYNGHPLYLFEGDSAPGQTNGEGISAFGAAWFAVSPAGNQVNGAASASGGAGGY